MQQDKYPQRVEISKAAKQCNGDAHAPVFKLSEDVLIYVFLLLTPNWSSVGYYSGPTYRTARTISQVCRQWRLVSLSCPNLWKSIELNRGSLEWIKELFSRSESAPFVELYNELYYQFDRVVELMPTVLRRIRFFSGSSLSHEAWVQFYRVAQEPGAQLEWLILTDFTFYEDSRLTFSGVAPPLRKLRLMRCHVDLCTPFYLNVSELSLTQRPLSIPNLLLIITNMPLLERLSVAGLLPSPDAPFCPIDVPSLTYLRLSEHADLLDWLNIRKECILNLYDLPLRKYGAVVKTITNRFILDHNLNGNSYLQLGIDRFGIKISNDKSIGSQSGENCDSLHITLSKARAGEQMPFEGWTRYNQNEDCVPALNTLLSDFSPILPKITFLELGGDSCNVVLPHLPRFPEVHTLYLGQSLKEVLPLLRIHYHGGMEKKVLLPSLHTLHLPRLFSPKREGDILKSFLAWRIKAGRPLGCIRGGGNRAYLERELKEYNVELK